MDEALIIANVEAHNPAPNPFWNMLAQLLKLEPRLPQGDTSVVHYGPFHGRDNDQDDIAFI